MSPDSSEEIDVAALAEHYDADSRDSYLSVYADVSNDFWRRALEDRVDEVRAVLEGRNDPELLEAFELDAETALDIIEGMSDKADGVAVYLSSLHDFERVHALHRPVKTQLYLDSGPYISPLVRYLGDYAPFVVILLDGQRGAVWRMEAGRAELEGTEKMDLIGRHKKGGFSQMRYQRHRADRVESFIDELIERVDDLVREEGLDSILVAGPGQAKDQLVERLPQHLRDMVDAVEDLDLDDPRQDPDVRSFVDLAKAVDEERSPELVKRLEDEVRGGGLGTTGGFACARAAVNGRVDTLVVVRGAHAGGRKCEKHRAFFEEGTTCGCGQAGTEVDLLEEAVEETVKTDGSVEYVDEGFPFLDKRHGVGAILRW